jgi:beta-glucosidase-like glycosyl hydrolase
MSDDLVAASTTNHADVGATAVGALRASVDLLDVPGGASTQERTYDAVMSAWSHGQISAAHLRASAERVIALKRTYHVLH